MKKLAILIVSTMALAATGCCGLHGGSGCNSCGYGGAAPTFGSGGCPNGNCGLGPTSYIAPTGTASAAAPGNTPTLATAPVAHQPFQRTAMVAPVETLPTF